MFARPRRRFTATASFACALGFFVASAAQASASAGIGSPPSAGLAITAKAAKAPKTTKAPGAKVNTRVTVARFEGETMSIPRRWGGGFPLRQASAGRYLSVWSSATATKRLNTTGRATRLVVRARGTSCEGRPEMVVEVDGRQILSASITTSDWAGYAAPVKLAAGAHTVAISFTNDAKSRGCDRNLHLDSIALTAPESPTFEGETMSISSTRGRPQKSSTASAGRYLTMWSNATASKRTAKGGTRLVVRASGAGCDGAPTMAVAVDGAQVLRTGVATARWAEYAAPVSLPGGSHTVDVRLVDDDAPGARCGRKLFVDTVTISGVPALESATTPVATGSDPAATTRLRRPLPTAPDTARPTPASPQREPVAPGAPIAHDASDGSNWRLTFADEFSGSTLDNSNWATDWGASFSKPTHFMPEQNAVRGGNLVITAERRQTPSGRPWASGLVNTHQRFAQTYGRFEARMKVPAGRAMFPAFWLMPESKPTWPEEVEIDIMEAIGQEPNEILQSAHFNDESGAHRRIVNKHRSSIDYTKDFHVYGLEWTPTRLNYIIDGVVTNTITRTQAIATTPHHMILNLAVGSSGDPGDWIGMPDSTTSDRSFLYVDWVRAYTKA